MSRKNFLVIVIILATISFLSFFIYNFIFSTDRLLINVMNSEKTFVDENGNELLFKNYKIYDKEENAEKYTFVDLDKDGINELAVYTTSYNGAYMIFRYDKETKKVYGYMLGIRSFQNVKVDGTFRGSNGAGSHVYCKINFNKNKLEDVYLAYHDVVLKKYIINNQKVSQREIENFVKDFENKKECMWETKKIKKQSLLLISSNFVFYYIN